MQDEVLDKIYDGRLAKRLVRYLLPYRRTVGWALLLLFIHAGLQIAGPLLTKVVVDCYLTKGACAAPFNGWLPADPLSGIYLILAIYLAAIVLTTLAEFGQTLLMQRTGQHAMFDLRREVMTHLQRLDIAYYDKNPVGRLVTRVTSDVDTLNELYTSGVVTILADLVVLIFIIVTMFRMNAGLTWIMLAVMPFVVLTTGAFRRAVTLAYQKTRICVAKINAYIQEHVNGVAVLQLYNREARAREDFLRINQEHMDAFKEGIHAYGWFYPITELLTMLALAGLLSYGAVRVHDQSLSLGVLLAFIQYGFRFFRPIADLSEKYNILQAAMTASDRVFKLLDTPALIVAPASPKPFPREAAAIEFDQVWFAYQGEDWVLRDLSFRIEPGQTVAAIGHTGAGKTTIISLLLRYYDIQRGHIRIGGIDLRDFDPLDLRRHFGVVLQDPFLFTGTIGENIRLGDDSLTAEDLEKAAREVNLLDFVNTLPTRFDYAVRERGLGLSTGQKQLVGFARALARQPRYLILDEATSSVDTETELRIREALDRLVTGRTSIVIAHRLSTIQRADRILVMHKGQLRESGTHQELLALDGLYTRLYQLQYQEQEAA
ncbi:MAG: ABC transporter ATP-binding protein/permease [Bryobacteraceae bacterium]|nr:ABC transporter ATP-binding protein/permease [Bryobacteraceae bacterium]